LQHFAEVVDEYDPLKSDYLLVTCGGDGTIYLAVNAYVKKRDKTGVPLTIGILPGGTANDCC
jgi:diacylglycerol kinase family enzyme